MPRVVLDMADRRPVWAMPEWVPEALRRALPDGWELRVSEEETEGSGDGRARVSAALLDAVSDAEVYLGYGVAEELLRGGPRLRWVHSGAAGVGSSLTPAMRASDVIFTNSAGVHAPPMAETVVGMLLHFLRGLDFAVRNQREGRWDTAPYYVAGAPLRELSELTVGIVGLGGVGRAVARRVRALGARVLALRRRSGRLPDDPFDPLAGVVALDDVDVLRGEEGLEQLLSRSDAVVLTVPDTPATRGLIDAGALERMKPDAVLVNVARGRVVDEDALLRALEVGRIRGAALDVFAREPLPPEHPFWHLPNVLITPHVSAVTRGYWRRETDLILHNLRCFLADAPPEAWWNVVDKEAGY